jgi:hypothetical protein
MARVRSSNPGPGVLLEYEPGGIPGCRAVASARRAAEFFQSGAEPGRCRASLGRCGLAGRRGLSHNRDSARRSTRWTCKGQVDPAAGQNPGAP